MMLSLDGEWQLGIDPRNTGVKQQWQTTITSDAKPTKVPWIIQDVFPGYHGVAWYWRKFNAPEKSGDDNNRTLLRFWAVDYQAEVWLNGVMVGDHEGGETPFVLDVTAAIQPGQGNLLTVRVLNPTDEPIDGILLKETPHRNKLSTMKYGDSPNHGGIVDSVELLTVPALYVEDIFVRSDIHTGNLLIQLRIKNDSCQNSSGKLIFSVAPAAQGDTCASLEIAGEFPAGSTCHEATLLIPSYRLWSLSDPFLYRVSARVEANGHSHEFSTRTGFRDFRFANGYFRLNGKRLFLRSSHTGNSFPVGLQMPHDIDLARRDMLNVKVMGFNTIRFIAGAPWRYQLDLCDEIGLLVYEENFASWRMEYSAQFAERFDRSLTEIIRRDRNHPSVVIWGLLNETWDDPVYQHALASLPLVRQVDDSRVVFLNSWGSSWETLNQAQSLSNPGSETWDGTLLDYHQYVGANDSAEIECLRSLGDRSARVDHDWLPQQPNRDELIAKMEKQLGRKCEPSSGTGIEILKTVKTSSRPVFLSEYGIASAVDVERLVRHYEQLGKEHAEDALMYRGQLTKFMADWEKWQLNDTFNDPRDFFAQCQRKMTALRLTGLNAIRANPDMVGHSLTGTVDQGLTGEGLCTAFREFKPGIFDVMADAWAPLRLCLFADPPNSYCDRPVRLEAVLANEDALRPGNYSLRLRVIGPDNTPVLERHCTVTIPDGEPSFAIPFFAENIVLNGTAGSYRFLAEFEHGAAACGGEICFYRDRRDGMPKLDKSIYVWGHDEQLSAWLIAQGIHILLFSDNCGASDVILIGARPPQTDDLKAEFKKLTACIEAGATAIFLSFEVFRKDDEPLSYLPLSQQGELKMIPIQIYIKDEWVKQHPIFTGLPCGGLMDYGFYWDIIPYHMWSGGEAPEEAVAGAIRTSFGYDSGLLLSIHRSGAGCMILNTLRITDRLGINPVAERLLRNMINYAWKGNNQ